MLIVLTILTLTLFLILLVAIRNAMCYTDEQIDEVTTVTTTVDYDFKGVIRRKWENGQPYVTDPADGAKWYLNTNDDMYEDANGDWWKLI